MCVMCVCCLDVKYSFIKTLLTYATFAAQGRVGDIIDELFDISSEYLGFISSNLAKVRLSAVEMEQSSFLTD